MSKLILTADDSASIRNMVKFTLKTAGYDCLEAADGKQALELVKKNKIDMIITDLNMPNMNGIELIKETRKTPGYRFIPIVMLTTESEQSKKMEGKKAGATGWIVKPFNQQQLLAVVKKVLK